ncbi:hypothetical protein ICW40_03360 [Actinotalea ferrariae]|uniref:hypothetical protein n=1 Tax=Actinotalea ferrariae TaxID=1386098 RepID=UPI001C8C9104|nr:hypothetical protein [Actinotalea ferrariae]MBX9243842.1 hypothetical protein [Actinotalea ferrariae]
MENFLDVVGALTPSIGVGLIFWLAMRKIIHADRNERAAQAALDRQVVRDSAARSGQDDLTELDPAARPGGRSAT